jgi:hypothetical protein
MRDDAFDKVRGTYAATRSLDAPAYWKAEASCARCPWKFIEIMIDSENEARAVAKIKLDTHLFAAHGIGK